MSISQYFYIIEKVQIFKIKSNLKSEKWKSKTGTQASIFKSLAEKKGKSNKLFKEGMNSFAWILLLVILDMT